MCRNQDSVICSPMLCELLLYCLCIVARTQLYVAKCYISGYYIVHVSSNACSCIQLKKTSPIHAGIYDYTVYYICNIKSHCVLSTHCACSLSVPDNQVGFTLTDCRTFQYLEGNNDSSIGTASLCNICRK